MSTEIKTMSAKELTEAVAALTATVADLQKKVEELQSSKTKSTASTRDMTDDDARRILTGDLATKSHKDAASELGLSYGQIYSCRLEFTFKNIHKEMKAAGTKNAWVK